MLIAGGEAAALFLFRFLAFGAFFPQPVYAKVGALSPVAISQGFSYVLANLLSPSFVAVAAICAIACGLTFRAIIAGPENLFGSPLTWLVSVFFLVYISFVMVTGGDWMEGGRFLVPVIPAGAVLCAWVIDRYVRTPAFAVFLVMAILAVQMGGLVAFAAGESIGRPAWTCPAAAAELSGRNIDPSAFSFFDIMDRVHLRDIPVSRELDRIVTRLLEEKKVVVILSNQAGFVDYTVFMRHFGQVRFIDLQGLATKDFTGCNLTSANPRSRTGIIVTYEDYLDNRDRLEKTCGIPVPDIIFGLGGPEMYDRVTGRGYTVVYRQSGPIGTGSILRGSDVPWDEFIAVRDDEAGRVMEIRPQGEGAGERRPGNVLPGA
jgi:hypothetical protein